MGQHGDARAVPSGPLARRDATPQVGIAVTPALRPSDRAPGLWIGEDVMIADDARIGANVVLHAGTAIASGAEIADRAVLGKRPRLAPRSRARGEDAAGAAALVVGAGASVGVGAIVFAGARIEAGALVGERVHVRERAVVGAEAVVGSGAALGTETVLGARVRVAAGAWLTSWTLVEDDALVGPGVATLNDDTMARLSAADALHAPVLRRACRIGGGVVIAPGVEIGAEALVEAGALVTRDVPPGGHVHGIPARAAHAGRM